MESPQTPGGEPPDRGPQAPQPGPQAPIPGPQAPPSPPPGYQPQPGPEGLPGGYTGQVPPGGWQTPAPPPAQPSWVGAPLASWGSRLGAWLLDGLILLVPAAVLFFVLVAGAVGISGDEDVSAGAAIAAVLLWFLVVAVIGLLYAPLLMAREGARNGQTWGKQAVSIRVVRDNGQPVGFGWAALREIVMKQLAVGIASSVIPLIPFLLNYCWPLFDDENRALHDLAVQSHVLRA